MKRADDTRPGSLAESDLYAPVRDYLKAQGFEVKAEVERCDVVARRGDEPPVIVELKRQLTLDLLLQGLDRLSMTDAVYLAVPRSARWKGRAGFRKWRRTLVLLRRLGLGLLVVDGTHVEAVQDPTPYAPRPRTRRRGRLLAEFTRREGDPNIGGVTRRRIVTGYRQEAVRLAEALRERSPRSTAELREVTAIPHAARILQRNAYGWFERVDRGVYVLSVEGNAADR